MNLGRAVSWLHHRERQPAALLCWTHWAHRGPLVARRSRERAASSVRLRLTIPSVMSHLSQFGITAPAKAATVM